MGASRWPWRLALAASISRSTSSAVRCSRVRSAAFGRRNGVTVGATSAKDEFAIAFAPFDLKLFNVQLFYERLRMPPRGPNTPSAPALNDLLRLQ